VAPFEALSNPSTPVQRLLGLAKAWPDTPDGVVAAPQGERLRTAKQLRESEVDELVAGYRAGASVYVLARQFGVHRGTVGRLLRSRGVDTTPVALTPAQVKLSAELYEEGWSLVKIARHFGVSENTVHRKLRAAGVAMRPATNAEWVEGRKS
jgi:IS30 family transposase